MVYLMKKFIEWWEGLYQRERIGIILFSIPILVTFLVVWHEGGLWNAFETVAIILSVISFIAGFVIFIG
jgi:hypothetical protein